MHRHAHSRKLSDSRGDVAVILHCEKEQQERLLSMSTYHLRIVQSQKLFIGNLAERDCPGAISYGNRIQQYFLLFSSVTRKQR